MDLRERVTVETPEMVEFSWEVAGLGSRFAAGFLDTLLLGMLILGLLGTVWLGGEAIPFATYIASALQGVVLLAVFMLVWGYHLYFEAFRGGRTPGKRLLRLRVVAESGLPVTLSRAAVRNLMRVVDVFPPPLYGLGGIVMFVDPRGRRIGDLAAGTVVVRERPSGEPAVVAGAKVADRARRERGLVPGGREGEMLRAFLARRDELSPEVRARLAASVAGRLATSTGRVAGEDPEAFLEALAEEGA